MACPGRAGCCKSGELARRSCRAGKGTEPLRGQERSSEYFFPNWHMGLLAPRRARAARGLRVLGPQGRGGCAGTCVLSVACPTALPLACFCPREERRIRTEGQADCSGILSVSRPVSSPIYGAGWSQMTHGRGMPGAVQRAQMSACGRRAKASLPTQRCIPGV